MPKEKSRVPASRDNWVSVPFRVRPEQFRAIERARGHVARERFLRVLVQEGLSRREPEPVRKASQ